MKPLATTWPLNLMLQPPLVRQGLNYHHNLLDLNNLSCTNSYTQLKQNQEYGYVGPAVANDSHVFYDSNHDLSLRKIDLNYIKRRSAI